MSDRSTLSSRSTAPAAPPGGLLARLDALLTRWRRRDRRGERGQSVVELSLVVPILMFTLLGVGDLARIYTTMAAAESAVREAADFGSFNSSNWAGDPAEPTSNHAKTVNAMVERVCAATSHLPDFQGTRTSCSNPAIAISLTEVDGSPATGCDDPERSGGPCMVQVDVDYTFDLIIPVGIEFHDVHLGLPDTLTISRTSIFANSDFELDQA